MKIHEIKENPPPVVSNLLVSIGKSLDFNLAASGGFELYFTIGKYMNFIDFPPPAMLFVFPKRETTTVQKKS